MRKASVMHGSSLVSAVRRIGLTAGKRLAVAAEADRDCEPLQQPQGLGLPCGQVLKNSDAGGFGKRCARCSKLVRSLVMIARCSPAKQRSDSRGTRPLLRATRYRCPVRLGSTGASSAGTSASNSAASMSAWESRTPHEGGVQRSRRAMPPRVLVVDGLARSQSGTFTQPQRVARCRIAEANPQKAKRS
jgi:hypothetical protein